ncbi:MAG: LysM peptidoglycan-binding domain-containing protein [Opitutus sp.]
MKILKIFGVVVGIHVFALVLIFANPGCSSPNKAAPSASDTVSKTDESPTPAARPASDGSTPVTIAGGDPVVSSAPGGGFDPNATAIPAIRFSPTRPGTPTASSLESAPTSDVTPASTYTVGKGDSLWTIAKKHHISIAEIAAANNLKANTPVRIGQKLIIPGKAISTHASAPEPLAPKAAAAASFAPVSRATGESVKHVVKSGETLGAIARKYQVKVGEIATANNISDPAKIRPGMELVIPGWQAPGSKSAKAAAPRQTTPAATTSETATPPSSTNSPILAAPEDTTAAPATSEPPVIRVDDKP